MADVPVEVKKAAPAQTNVPDAWHWFRDEMNRLFDRFSAGASGCRRCAGCSTSSRHGEARSAFGARRSNDRR